MAVRTKRTIERLREAIGKTDGTFIEDEDGCHAQRPSRYRLQFETAQYRV